MKTTDLTLYADVNGLLRPLITAVRAILNDQFVGMVLDGSLASGDFDYEIHLNRVCHAEVFRSIPGPCNGGDDVFAAKTALTMTAANELRKK